MLDIALVKNNAMTGAKIACELSLLRRKKVAVVGGIAVDVSAEPSALKLGTSNPGQVQRSFGGVGRNIAECIARLGNNPYMISAVGNDVLAEAVLRNANQLGIKTDFVLQSKSNPTSSYISVTHPETRDLAFGISDMGVLSELSSDYVSSITIAFDLKVLSPDFEKSLQYWILVPSFCRSRWKP
jgi:pseudouridine-5'-phosphate glycosidase/pseudouridine kinase